MGWKEGVLVLLRLKKQRKRLISTLLFLPHPSQSIAYSAMSPDFAQVF
jgi:hypothetical protein